MNSKQRYQSELPIRHDNLSPSGDTLLNRTNDDGITRLGFQNINGIKIPKEGAVSDDFLAMEDCGADIQGFVECNCPCTQQNKHLFQLSLQEQYNNNIHMAFSASPVVSTSGEKSNYQPGGVMQIVRGTAFGRITSNGTDKLGRYSWHCLAGSRDEGIVVITAYRVCQERSNNAGPKTAFMQQYTALLEQGITDPNPREQLLKDLSELIAQKRQSNYKPILMMDANGSVATDEKFRKFLLSNNLIDPYYVKFKASPPTYVRGTKRLDYIVMDESLSEAVARIGYLGSHEGVVDADHSYAYVDFRSDALFCGSIHRPTPMNNRQFTLLKTEKVHEFLELLHKALKSHRIEEKVGKLLADFRHSGLTDENVASYNTLDNLIYMNIVVGAANKIARKDFGYMRSPVLTEAGQRLNYQKAILDCLRRNAGPSSGLLKLAELLEEDIPDLPTEGPNLVRDQYRKVRQARKQLWERQKAHHELRLQWLENLAQIRAELEGVPVDKKLESMQQAVLTKMVNRKLTRLTKGDHSQLDRIEVPIHNWYYSSKTEELYHYDRGVFETHSRLGDQRDSDGRPTHFYRHHTLKVLEESEAVPVEVEINDAAILLKNVLPKQAIWQTITEPKEIERLLMERNKRHLQQVSIEEGPATKPPISTFLRNEGISTDSEAVLNGTYTESIEVDPILAQWINNLKKPDAQQYFEQFSIDGAISADELQAAFKAVNERTSSAGPIHYTLWKCMAAEDSLAHWMAIMLSIPFLYGFAPSRWTDMVDVMLEKKKGNRKIHMLRIIGLIAPDFNTALKHFARKFAVNSESTNSLSEEQWGSRNNRQAIDAAMLKLLGFECARLKRSTVACTYFDQSACYDRMLPELSTILCQRMGMSKNLLKARSRVMHAMRRRVQTGIGISNGTYGNEPGEPVLCGEIQGKGDNPSLYNAQSSTMLNTHAQIAPGLRLNSCQGDGCIHRHNVSYVDDNDGNVSADHQLDFDAALQEVIGNLRESSQMWNTLVEFTGQSVSLHKCSWQVLAWKVVDGQMSIVEATDTTLLLVDHKGAPAIIQFLPPDQPNKGLGFLLCPDGNQRHQYKKVLETTTDIAMACSSTFLNPSEARQLLYERLVPKVDYSLHLTSFSEKQCEDLNTVVRQHFLPKLGFNRNTPTAVVHGPMDQGGLDIIDFRSRQDELQVPDVIKHLRWGKTVANDLRVTLDNLQLVAGLTEPVLEDTEIGIRYVDRGFISCLQDRLGEIDGSLWVEDAWTPKKQRVDDESLMERFSMGLKAPRNATGKVKSIMSIDILKKLNAVRMYMRVITVADLTDLSGTVVSYDKLTGDFRADSELEWPNQPKPPSTWFKLFRKFFRQTFCWNMPPGSDGDFELDDPLGDWYDVPRHIRWPCYRSKDAIYYRGRNSDGHAVIQMFKKSKHNFFKYESDVESPPLNSHPAQAVFVDDSAWTTKPCRIEPTPRPEARPPGYITHCTHSSAPTLNPKETCSDGSINYIHQTAAAAWIIAEDKDKWIQAAFLMTDVSSLTSYRAELEGIFRSLYHMDYLGMEPTQTVTQWCDNRPSGPPGSAADWRASQAPPSI
jgi:hypothetical protein